MRVIVGLGNPGRTYVNNRHNVGFLCLNRLARMHRLSFDRVQQKSRIALGRIANEDVLLAKPRTYMNLSGEAVAALLKEYSLPHNALIVIYDDLDLPLGKLRISSGGGSGGHKGVESIISYLGRGDFLRIRVGIGRPGEVAGKASEDDIINYVLGDFTAGERSVVKGVIERVAEAIPFILTEGVMAAMNRYN